MPVSWKPSTSEAHEALPKKRYGKVDPEWEAVIDELTKGNTVMIEYHDNQERSTLTRSVGHRAAHRGFKVDLRTGDGFISVRRTEDSQVGKGRKRG